MAIAIAPTPRLKGKDALRFMERMADVKPASKKRKAERERNFEWVKSIATFAL